MGMIILAVLGVNINEATAAEIRCGRYNSVRDMNKLNPLVYFIINFMLFQNPFHRYTAMKFQSEILVHF